MIEKKKRLPGRSERVSAGVLALGLIVIAIWDGGEISEEWRFFFAALAVVFIGEIQALRAHADARWDKEEKEEP